MNALASIAHVVRAEMFKALRKRRFYVLGGLYWVLLPALALIVGRVVVVNLSRSFANQGGNVEQIVQGFASPFGIARIALMGPALMSPTGYIIAIALFAGLLLGEERSQHMWKTTLVVQPARLAVLAGKAVVGMLLLGALLLGAFVASVIGGAIGTLFLPTTFAGGWAALVGLYALQWLYLAGALLLAYLLVYLVRSGSLGIVTVIFLPALLEGLYALISTLGAVQPLTRLNAVFQALRLQRLWEALPRYFFTPNLYAPARSPLGDLVRSFGGDVTGGSQQLGPLGTFLGSGITLPHAAAVMAGYTVLFAALLAWLFVRRDVE